MASHGVAGSERQTFRRYEWAEPGALLHMDVKRLARFDMPGHWAKGRAEEHRTRHAGWAYLHVVIDDHSRYLYVEQHDHEDADTNANTLKRAIAHFTELGLAPPQAVMTDNALVYTNSRRFREVLHAVGAHTSPPRLIRRAGTARPRESSALFKTNGPTRTPGTAPGSAHEP